MPMPLHILIVLFTGLWFIVRWTSILSARALVWLYQTWRQRSEPMESSTHRTDHRIIYTGKWLLADDHQCSGRAVVLKHRHNYKPGVELQYFGEETPQAFYGERYMDSEDEAVDTALAMHQKLLRNVRQRPKPERMPAVVTISSAAQNDEAA
ncbi:MULTISPECIES: hypothetical protein [Pectobacterium]|uniref:hypothetical protein n=1 Tax=Pectobacterium TaxID=122277 RepID=UPI001F40BA6D|nr:MULTISPECIES: hypothetical protein [Pectobacterium]WDF99854.1 hypothetical protein PSR30_04605 [Pectobacterium carotovorum subsp. carotovorum]GKV90472.1 hypothetical protein PEC301619_24540 [Pectobacterium carotovorum subsp. carotovorum]